MKSQSLIFNLFFELALAFILYRAARGFYVGLKTGRCDFGIFAGDRTRTPILFYFWMVSAAWVVVISIVAIIATFAFVA